MLEGMNCIVIDCEVTRSPNECLYCGAYPVDGNPALPCTNSSGHERIGWDNKLALGLSVGCYWDYQGDQYVFFGAKDIDDLVTYLITRQPLMVTFNGLAFDLPLIRLLLRQMEPPDTREGRLQQHHCDLFATQCHAHSYDLLDVIWRCYGRSAPKGVNSLDGLAAANGLPRKEMTGEEAPIVWQRGDIDRVKAYCQADVDRTKALFEMVCRGEVIQRLDGVEMTLPLPPGLPLQRDPGDDIPF